MAEEKKEVISAAAEPLKFTEQYQAQEGEGFTYESGSIPRRVAEIYKIVKVEGLDANGRQKYKRVVTHKFNHRTGLTPVRSGK